MSNHHRDRDHEQERENSHHHRDPAAGPAAAGRRGASEELVDLAGAAALAALQECAPAVIATLRELHRLGETTAAVEQRLLAAGTGIPAMRVMVATAYEHLHRHPSHG